MAWKKGLLDVMDRFQRDWEFYDAMVGCGYDPEYINKIDTIAKTTSVLVGMPFEERLFEYGERWDCKLVGSGSNTNPKGKRTGAALFGAGKNSAPVNGKFGKKRNFSMYRNPKGKKGDGKSTS